MSEILWQPDRERIQRSKMFRFLQSVNETFSLQLNTYLELHRWSVQELEAFWEYYRTYSGIQFSRPPDKILSTRSMPGARWFEGAELNYAQNLLADSSEKTAIISKVEGRLLTTLSYSDLAQQVRRFGAALLELGVQPGDRVAGFMPNIPETVIAMLGTTAIGAVWTSCSPDFGSQGLKDRFGQVEPSVLVCSDGYFYNGKSFPVLDTVNALVHEAKHLKRVVVVPFMDPAMDPAQVEFPETSLWDDFLKLDASQFSYQPFAFNHPLFVMYSSGTTGLPKCIVHGAGGTLLQHHKEHALHTDIGPEDVVFYYTTCGWMMWNWLVSVLAQKAAIVLYEGSPGFPDLHALWDLIDEANITVFGTSPKFLSQNIKTGIDPSKRLGLSTLRTILSTGAPLDEECFRWVYHHVKSDLQMSSISGGTDIISCFMLGNPILPVRCEEIQCLGLGMDVVSLNGKGQPVLNQKGELACRSPEPSMPVSFWNDPDGSKYSEAYFDKIPGIWLHGDYIEVRDSGGVIVYGRSDATLNPGGVRIGTAEIYRIVERLEEVMDSLVIGVDEDNDLRVLLFLVLKNGQDLDADLKLKIQQTLRCEATPRHVPHEMYSVGAVPKTLNGKKMELAVREIFQGSQTGNRSSMSNPECLKDYEVILSNRSVKNHS
ncbi:MAG: acetoacetate--CoA ligase [Nitrospinaceae bacterium]